MVNFKASLMQGEHKRALAAQDGEKASVSKLEKMKLRPDAECVNANGIALRVGAREKILGGESNAHMKAAIVAPGVLKTLGAAADASRALLCRPGSDFVLSARESPEVEPGAVLLGEAQRLSLHVCEDESYEWVPFEHPGSDMALASLAIEAQLLTPPTDGPITLDAAKLGRELAKRLFDEMASDNEIFMYEFESTKLVLRVCGAKFPEKEDEEDDEEEDEAAVEVSAGVLLQAAARRRIASAASSTRGRKSTSTAPPSSARARRRRPSARVCCSTMRNQCPRSRPRIA